MTSSRSGTTLDRDQQILSRLAKIEHKVDSIEQTNAFALRAEADKHFAEVSKIFGRSLRRAQVYLAADGNLSVQEIAAHLGMKRQNVGSDLKHLGEEGLLELVDSYGNKDIWSKKPIDRTLRITPFLCQQFSLQKNGLKRAAGKRTAGKKKR
jgi:Fic family protein